MDVLDESHSMVFSFNNTQEGIVVAIGMNIALQDNHNRAESLLWINWNDIYTRYFNELRCQYSVTISIHLVNHVLEISFRGVLAQRPHHGP